jgi:hypothetical protein
MPRQRRSTTHQRARAKSGNKAEDGIEQLHVACRMAGVANVRRVPTPTRLKRLDGRLLAVHSGKQGIDCRGWMMDGTGRGVAVEIKKLSRLGEKFYLNQVTAEERRDLDCAFASRCVAVLMVVTPVFRYALPWPDVRERVGLTPEEMHPHRVIDPAYLARWAQAPNSSQ